MAIRSIQHSESMETVWDELVYTEARLLISGSAREQAPPFKELLARWEKVSLGQRQVWRAEIAAQAAVDAEDEALDALVDEIEGSLYVTVNRDRTDPRYRRYFKRPRNEVLRQALESELETVRDWPKSLKSEPEAELQALGKQLERRIASGDATVAERRTAAATRADHRVRDILPFIEAVNGARQALYGALVTRGQKEGLHKSWAEGFFRKRPVKRTPEATPDAPAAAPPTA